MFLFVTVVGVGFALLPLARAPVHTSFSPFGYRKAWLHTAESLGRSVLFAILGASVLTTDAFFVAVISFNVAPQAGGAQSTRWPFLRSTGTVIGVGLIALWNHSATGFVYGSSAMLILAYVAQYCALTSRISIATLANVPVSVEDAAQIGGAPWLSRLRYVVLPASLPGVIAAWAVAFIFCLRDLGASMLVYPAGADTLPVRIFTLMANGSPSMIAAACVSLIVINLAMLAALAATALVLAKRR